MSSASSAMSAALVVAASNNDVAAVRRLLADGADALSARDAEGFTPLTRAVARGHKDVLNVLLSQGGREQVKASANKVRMCARAGRARERA
jgi:ankyrin repeat protein